MLARLDDLNHIYVERTFWNEKIAYSITYRKVEKMRIRIVTSVFLDADVRAVLNVTTQTVLPKEIQMKM